MPKKNPVSVNGDGALVEIGLKLFKNFRPNSPHSTKKESNERFTLTTPRGKPKMMPRIQGFVKT